MMYEHRVDIMNEQCFYKLLISFSIVAFISSVYFTALNIIYFNHDLNKLICSIKRLPSQNQTVITEKLINGQGQGTTSWAFIFLAAITVFFMILLDLRKTRKIPDKETDTIDIVLSIIAALFLVASILSIFEILNYYRITAKLQQLYLPKNIYDAVPKGILFWFVMNNWGEYAMIILPSIVMVAVGIKFLRKKHTSGQPLLPPAPSAPLPPPPPSDKYKSQFLCKACGRSFWVYENRLKVPFCQECGAPDPVHVVTVDYEGE